MKYTAIHYVNEDTADSVIMTDDYSAEEIALGKHILDLKRDVVKFSLTGVLVVYDEQNNYVATI